VRLIPRSLSGRLVSLALALIVVALLAAGTTMYLALHRFVQGQVDGRLDGQIVSVRDGRSRVRTQSFGRPHSGPTISLSPNHFRQIIQNP
jgi:hypothetical protein